MGKPLPYACLVIVLFGLASAFIGNPMRRTGIGGRTSQLEARRNRNHLDILTECGHLLVSAQSPRHHARSLWSASAATNQKRPRRKLNPLETIIKVYADSSGKRESRPDRQYPFFTGLPLKPYFDRLTVRNEEIPGKMWSFEQPQAFFNVSVNIRMTAIRLEDGGLWIHAPIAPTEECVRLVTELGEEVLYIVLPTTAFEHKVYVKPFSDRFPDAKVYVCPGQWSWPINLPPAFRVDGILDQGSSIPWEGEIKYKLFSPPLGGVGPSNEVVFFHKATKTLLVTDCVICIPRDPPSVVDAADLLEAAAEEGEAPLEDTAKNRRDGWAKMSLQVLFLGPARADTFEIVVEKLIVSPVLRTLTLGRVLPYVRNFAERLCDDWPNIEGVIGCHYSGRKKASSLDFRRAFGFAFVDDGSSESVMDMAKPSGPLEEFAQAVGLTWLSDTVQSMLASGTAGDTSSGELDALARVPEEDFETLRSVNDFVVRYGLADTSKDG